ncbi:MAG: heme lyase CcmF/NrfE family subunit [Myxococcota bacterium]
MNAHLGNALVLAALAFSTVGAIAGFAGGVTRSAAAWRASRIAAAGFAASMVFANAVMEYALLTHDFSVRYVADVGSLATPVHITIVSLWSSLEGSILFWGLVLGVFIALATFTNGERDPETMPWAMGTWLSVGAFFSFLLAGPADPFLPQPFPVPTDGPGPNPLLQNHVLMIVHPPALYLGYVGMTIPFGHAVGALVTGRLGALQLKPMRASLVVAWVFLTAGIVLGGWWAYEVLGWGGYWAWDPVENASLLPWLTATAALHAAMLPHRRGSMKGWTVTLVLASFLLTLLGTFMTRSGVFNSVHSFSQSDIGPTLLAFIAVCLLASVFLLATRVDKLEAEGSPNALLSRESAFMVNNLLFVALTFTVLVGTTFPLLAEAIKGTKLSVGEPYFNRMAVPVGVAILFLMGVGPALPWGAATPDRVRKALLLPLAGSAVLVGGARAIGLRGAWPLAALAAAGFAAVVTARELAGAGRNLRRVGGYVVHAGIVVLLTAVAMSSAYRVDREIELNRGECATFEGYELCYRGPRTVEEPHRTLEIADVTADGELLSPVLATYPMSMSPIGSPAVRSTLAEDLYVSLTNLEGDHVALHVYRTPLVVWIWLGSGIAILGALVALVPQRAIARTPAVEVAPVAEATGK